MKNCLLLLLTFSLFSIAQAQTDSTDTIPVAPAFDFEVQAIDKVVVLKWNLAYSEDLKGFDIERSDNGGNHFIKVGSKLAISKGSDAVYDFVDATPKPNTALLYRLKLIAQNGSFSYSVLRETKLPDTQLTVRLKQNPVRTNLELEVLTTTAKQGTVVVVANSGQQVAAQTVRLAEGANQLTIPAGTFPQGMYQLAVEAGNERRTIPFIKE